MSNNLASEKGCTYQEEKSPSRQKMAFRPYFDRKKAGSLYTRYQVGIILVMELEERGQVVLANPLTFIQRMDGFLTYSLLYL